MIRAMLARRRVQRSVKDARRLLRAYDRGLERSCSDAFCGVFYANFVALMALHGPQVALENIQAIIDDTSNQVQEASA